MTLMVLSIFSGVALADPIQGGGDASNYYSSASTLERAIPSGSWYIYGNAYLQTSDVDWYNLNTNAGQLLSYELDTADWPYVLLDIYTSSTTTIGNDNVGSVYVSGNTKQKTILSGGHSVDDWYQFRLKIN
ncbi:MAG: hypothetical protein MPEBLZ_00294 [Candidatus Methanoperedens nitroreducens]|uniref:Uncharacterized protein n=2 Tax=Candidatus Methanoperedens TaxID=1392997 RepID=A0A0P8CN98_9EURY|nr:MAG: hypothetical protein MPEBLZ_00294 [Candidatus Methanoperedens sp. BLZ1]MCX9079814.1 hypothetical protein [Candidatus Methanoperedens sp.]CAG0992280.1 hypothetical protein METP2_02694 [Methanosarcinales archaeon]